MNLIKAYAVIRFMQRVQIVSGGVICITATSEDFQSASNLYTLLNGISGGQTTKLTKQESDILDIIDQKKWPDFTIAMLQKATGLANGTLHRSIHGYRVRGYSYTGLLEKCPAIAYTDRMVVCEEEGVSMRRRSHAYTFDKGLYEVWSKGGITWIEDEMKPAKNNQSPASPIKPAKNFAGFGNDDERQDSYSKYIHTHTLRSKRSRNLRKI